MSFALIARVAVDPERILTEPQTHDLLHAFVSARFAALRRLGPSLF